MEIKNLVKNHRAGAHQSWDPCLVMAAPEPLPFHGLVSAPLPSLSPPNPAPPPGHPITVYGTPPTHRFPTQTSFPHHRIQVITTPCPFGLLLHLLRSLHFQCFCPLSCLVCCSACPQPCPSTAASDSIGRRDLMRPCQDLLASPKSSGF